MDIVVPFCGVTEIRPTNGSCAQVTEAFPPKLVPFFQVFGVAPNKLRRKGPQKARNQPREAGRCPHRPPSEREDIDRTGEGRPPQFPGTIFPEEAGLPGKGGPHQGRSGLDGPKADLGGMEVGRDALVESPAIGSEWVRLRQGKSQA